MSHIPLWKSATADASEPDEIINFGAYLLEMLETEATEGATQGVQRKALRERLRGKHRVVQM